MAVEGLGCRKTRQFRFAELQGAMQKAAWPGRIHNKARLDCYVSIGTSAAQLHPIIQFGALRQVYFIQIFNAKSLGLPQEEKVEVRSVPVGVRDSVVRAGRNQ